MPVSDVDITEYETVYRYYAQLLCDLLDRAKIDHNSRDLIVETASIVARQAVRWSTDGQTTINQLDALNFYTSWVKGESYR